MSRLTFEKMGGAIYYVKNDKLEIIGLVFFCSNWKRYVFETTNEYVHSRSCLQEIVDFMKKLGGKS